MDRSISPNRIASTDKRVYLFGYTIYMFLAIIICNYISGIEYNSWLAWINTVIISMLIVQIFCSYKLFGGIFNLSFIVLIFTYLFNLSYPIELQFAGPDYVSQVYYKSKDFNISDIREMVYYAVIFIAILFWGTLFYEVVKKKKRVVITSNKAYNYKALAILMIVVALPVDVAFMYIRIQAMMAGGYGVALATAAEGKYYASFFSYLLIAGVFILAKTKEGPKGKIYVILYCIYEMMWMFAGQRATPLICIIVIVWLYWGFGKKIPTSKKILGFVLFGGIALLLNVIREFRETGFQGISMESVLSLNIIFDSMTEFGYTLNIFGYVLESNAPHTIGSSLLYDLLCVIPKVSQLGFDTKSVDIYNALDLHDKGASYLAEILYDFKQYSYFVVALYGIYIRWLDCKFSYLITAKDYNKVLKYIPLAVITVFCVRTGLVNLFRTFVWSWILISIAQFFSKSGHKTSSPQYLNKIANGSK